MSRSLQTEFVDDPKKIVKVGQIVKVRILEVNIPLKRIALTMKSLNSPGHKGGKSKGEKTREEKKTYTLEDLKAKFKNR